MDIINDKHISKLIFDKIGQLLNKSPIECYKTYLQNSFNTNLNLKTFSNSMTCDVRHAQFYFNNDAEPCRFFSHTNYKNWSIINNNSVA